MDLMESMQISASGMHAQSVRIKVASENIANANSVIGKDGVNPYAKQSVVFKSVMDQQTGVPSVEVDHIVEDPTAMRYEYDPKSQYADENGLVKMPDISSLKETTDIKDASRAYEANMSAIETAKSMMSRSLDLLK